MTLFKFLKNFLPAFNVDKLMEFQSTSTLPKDYSPSLSFISHFKTGSH